MAVVFLSQSLTCFRKQPLPPEPTPEEISTQQSYLSLGLSDSEYQLVCDLLGRKPNLTETGIYGVMWSEHCSYKTSKMQLSRFPTEGPNVCLLYTSDAADE